ncbi:MAG: hypothetical protein GY810_07300 [Aureispira sp.]|nr:hypothetical protein [Aureispira sp.]
MALFPLVLIIALGVVVLFIIFRTSAGVNSDILDNVQEHVFPPTNDLPDRPIPFGYKRSWMAISSTHSKKILKDLGIKHFISSNWASGLQYTRHGSYFFISPPLGNWTLVINDIAYDDQFKPMLERLSEEFGEVQAFATDRRSEYHFWARAVNGVTLRYCSFSDDGVTVNGAPSTIEQDNKGLKIFQDITPEAYKQLLVNDIEYWPSEDDVMEIAGHWSINPCELHQQEAVGLGILGYRP